MKERLTLAGDPARMSALAILDHIRRLFGAPGQHSPDAADDRAVVNEASIAIAAPAPSVYALLDPASASNRWALRGDRLDPVDAFHGLYRLIDQRAPDQAYLVQIDETTPGVAIATTSVGDGGAPIGVFAKSESHYRITPTQAGCDVVLVERSTFLDGLPTRMLKRHARMMADGVNADLRRLKEEAEGGGA